MLALLKVASRGEATVDGALRSLQRTLERAHEDRDVSPEAIRPRLTMARRHLLAARLLEETAAGRVRITERGRRVLREHPMGVDDSVLMAFPEFRDFIHRASERPPVDYPAPPERHSKEYQEGYIAYRRGRSAADNPYGADSVNHLAWQNGWSEARDEDSAPSP